MTTLAPTSAAAGAGVALATSFSNTISTGTVVLTAVLAVGSIVSLIYGIKWKATAQAAAATIELWQQNAEGEKVRADQALEEKVKLATEGAELKARVVELERAPKLSGLEAIMLRHEERAQDRSDRMVNVLERIEKKVVGPEQLEALGRIEEKVTPSSS